ncbi:hypothetical protein TIFTF001_044108 [Ficus carica]|uniref:Uncharacterized protein n=1 Tax=Ficus carica TaxID=3494 RepID=A0AA88CS41_FICCA|nr:hypothetical protein TIFTF001_044108 [Ficus carica]
MRERGEVVAEREEEEDEELGFEGQKSQGPGARGDPADPATLGTRWVRRPVGATGLIDGRHVALGPGSVNSRTPWASRARGGSEYSEQWPPEYPVPTELSPPRPNECSQSSSDPSQEGSRLDAFTFYARYEQASGRLLGCLGVLRGVAVEFRHVSVVPRFENFTWHRAAGGKAIRQPKFQNLNLRERLAGSRTGT